MNLETVILVVAIAAALIYFLGTHFATFKAKLEGIEKQLGLIHTTANAPVTVALVPAQPLAQAGATTANLSLPPVTPAAAPVNPEWQRRRALYGDDLWAVQKGENVSLTLADMAPAKAAGFTKTDAFATQWAAGRAIEPASSFDPNQANVTPDDAGKNFHVGPGQFTRTLTIPDGYTGGVRCFIDKINDKADDAITILVDGALATSPSPNFPIGEFATIRGAGRHTISGAASDNVFVWTLQLVP
jgi:hypothetical protein